MDAFNRMDIDAIIAFRSDDCMRHILPSTLGYPPTNNKQYRASLERLVKIFKNFSLTIDDVVEDKEARKISMYLRARADTLAGEYVNEYMWTLSFDESCKIIKATEFVDTIVNRDFWPLLMAAMKSQQGSQSSIG